MERQEGALIRLVRRMLHANPRVPLFARPLIRATYLGGVAAAEGLRLLYQWLVVVPVMQSIATVGRRLRIERLPYIRGPGRLSIGSDVYISGKIGITFSRFPGETPELSIGDRSFVGHNCGFAVGRKIAIGNDCLLGTGVRVQDHDGHPLDAQRRLRKERCPAEAIAPVKVEDGAWIAPYAIVLKGVTIGKNAVVGTASVVTRDVPPYALAAGNPARVIRFLNASPATSDKPRRDGI